MDNTLRNKYQPQISEVEIFLNSNTRAAARKLWTSNQQIKWLMRQEKCPTCETKLTTDNLTKEHIHPLCLGGAERDDNIIAMCHDCNESRNNTMNAVLGGNNPKNLRNRWPANRTSVEEFIFWCHATVYGDPEAIQKLQHIDESFRKFRGWNKAVISPAEKPVQIKEKSLFDSFSKVFSKIKSVIPRTPSKVKINCVNCKNVLLIPQNYTGLFKCPSCDSTNGPDLKIESTTNKQTTPAKSKPKSNAKVHGDILVEEINRKTVQTGESLRNEFSKYIVSKLNETGELDLGRLAKPHFDIFVIQKGFAKFVDLKVAMGYSKNKKLKDIMLEVCGDLITISCKQIGPHSPRDYVKLTISIKETNSVQPVGLSAKQLTMRNDLSDIIVNNILEREDDWVLVTQIGDALVLHSERIGFDTLGAMKSGIGFKVNTKLLEIITTVCGNRIEIKEDALGIGNPHPYAAVSKFELNTWLSDNWNGSKQSYDHLKKDLINFERTFGDGRSKVRDILKEDFEIPKNWDLEKIIKELNQRLKGVPNSSN